MTAFKSAWLAAAALLVLQSSAAADVLVLRDGRRVEGILISVRADLIEFEPRSGRDQGRVVRFDRNEVRSLSSRNARAGTVTEMTIATGTTRACGPACVSGRSSSKHAHRGPIPG
jgi:hypothetical protein